MELDTEYKNWISNIKDKIRSSQLKAATAVNHELIALYWDLGKMIVEKQEQSQWGAKLIEQVAKDLKRELPDTDGFSRTNLFAMRQFFLFYRNSLFVHQPGGQLDNTSKNQSLSIDNQNNELVHQHGGLIENELNKR